MKYIKILVLSLVILCYMMQLKAQTNLFFQDFSNWPLSNMVVESGPNSIATGDGTWHNNFSEAVARYYEDSIYHNEFLITNTIEIPSNSDDQIKLTWEASLAYFEYFVENKSSFDTSYHYDPNANVLITIDDGITWDTLWAEDDSLMVANSGVPDWPWIDEFRYSLEVDLAEYAGQSVKIAWQFEGWEPVLYWAVDNISVFTQSPIDIELNKLTTSTYSDFGDVEITGIVNNHGTLPITSFDISYNIDGGTESSLTHITGINLELNDSYLFKHDDFYDFTSDGLYNITVTISNVNNGGDETLLSNNKLSKSITIENGFIRKRSLFEDYTSSTCGPCAYANETTLAPYFENFIPEEEFSLIKYPMYFPGDGDPYYIPECGERANLYSIAGVPHFRMDGVQVPHAEVVTQGPDVLKEYYETNKNYSATMTMDATYSLDESSKDLSVEIIIDSRVDYSNVKLYIAVVEKETLLNIGSNGETSFNQVLMKMLPNGNGKTIDLVQNNPTTFTFNTNLNATNIEEYDDLEIISFVQKKSPNLEVLQSAIAKLNTTVNVNIKQNKLIEVFPNPNSGQLTISNAANSKIEIYNSLSNLIFSNRIYNDLQTLNISNLTVGTYFLKVIDSEHNVSFKKIVKIE